MRGDVRNRQATHWDWGWLRIPGSLITPSDGDVTFSIVPLTSKAVAVVGRCDPAEVERNGRFLRIDTKYPGETMTTGVAIKLCAEARRGDTVWIIRGDADNSIPESIEVIPASASAADVMSKKYLEPSSRADVQHRFSSWLINAE